MKNPSARTTRIPLTLSRTSFAFCLALPLLFRLFLFAPSAADAQSSTLTLYAGDSAQQPIPVPTGTVNVQPDDNFCASSGAPCQFSYPSGAALTLLASAPQGFNFQYWFELDSTTPYFGAVVGAAPIYSLPLDVNRTLYASFLTNTSGFFNLTVYKGVPGLDNGSVTGTGGFLCDTNAGSSSQSFPSGTVVALTNRPAPGWAFAYWLYGNTTYTGRTFTLTMDRDQLVQAVFTQTFLPPTVSIVAPANNSTLWACTPVRLTATATAPSGWITSIDFFLDSTNGVRFASKAFATTPATALAAWWIDAVGVTDTFVARATDNNGAQTVSAPVSVTTTSPPLFYMLDGITNNQCEVCMSAPVGHAYSILATTNFLTWTNLGSMNGTNIGFLTFVDPAFTNLPYRFYRAQVQTNQ